MEFLVLLHMEKGEPTIQHISPLLHLQFPQLQIFESQA